MSYEEIMGWFCQGVGFGEIEQAYSLSHEFGMPVADIFALRQAGMGWGEIRKYLENLPTGTPVPSETPEPSGTPGASETPQPSVTPEPTQGGPTSCTGADSHPTGMSLAQQYAVSYEEIMGWFCQGFGFGEIEHAYSLSLESGTPVADIFAMRSSGMGWDEIRKALLGDGDDGNPGNGNGNDNPHKKDK